MGSLTEYINEIVIAGTGIVTSLVAWKTGHKQAKASHLDNVEKAIQIWENTSIKLQDKLTGVEGEILTIKQNHEACEESKRELIDKVNELERTIHNIIGTPKDLSKGK